MIVLFIVSISVFSYCIILKLEDAGENAHENKGVFPEMPLWEISNFAQPVNADFHTQKTDYDTIKIL